MSDITVILVAIIAAGPPTFVAWLSFLQSKKNSVKSDTIIEKAAEIHTLTNSNLSKVTTALEVANAKIEGLQVLVAALGKANDQTSAQ